MNMKQKNRPAVPEGWSIIDVSDLQKIREEQKLVNEAVKKNGLIRYFDGRNPTLRDALAREEIPRRKLVDELGIKISKALPQGLGVTTLLGGGGEGKSTVFLQTICDLLENNSVQYVILPQNMTSRVSLSIQYLQKLPRDQGRWLIAVDDAETIADQLFNTVSTLYHDGRKNLHFFLCCRDIDWRGVRANQLTWHSNTDYYDDTSRLSGLKDEDAHSIVLAWRKAGAMGAMKALSDKKATEQLITYARDEATQADGSFLGAMLRTRIGRSGSPEMRDHVQSLLTRLEDRDKEKPYGQRYLLDAYAYIAAFHVENLFLLTENILAVALGIDNKELQANVIGPLGEEAGIATKPAGKEAFSLVLRNRTIPLNNKKIFLTRHKAIAETAADLLFNRQALFKPDEIYKRLYAVTAQYFDVKDPEKWKRTNRVPDMHAWRRLPDYFSDTNRPELAIELAWVAINDDPTDTAHVIRLASFYLEDKQITEAEAAQKAVKLYRERYSYLTTNKDSVYYNKWATAEGKAGNHAVSIWLDSIGIADGTILTSTEQAKNNYIEEERYKLAMSGMSYDFKVLYEQAEEHSQEQQIFLNAWRAIIQFGIDLRWQSKSDANNPQQLLLQSQREAWEHMNIRHIPPSIAFQYMEKGIESAWKLCQHELPDLPPGNQLRFEKFRQVIQPEGSNQKRNRNKGLTTTTTDKPKEVADLKPDGSTPDMPKVEIHQAADDEISIEQKAQYIRKDLRDLAQKISNHPELATTHNLGDNVDAQAGEIEVSLRVHIQLLREARDRAKLHPNDTSLEKQIEKRYIALASATREGELLLQKFPFLTSQ